MKYILGVISLAALLLGVVHANDCIEEKIDACEVKYEQQADADYADCSLFGDAAECVRGAHSQCDVTEEDAVAIEFVAGVLEGFAEACEEVDDSTEKRSYQKRFVAKRGYRRALKRAWKRGGFQ